MDKQAGDPLGSPAFFGSAAMSHEFKYHSVKLCFAVVCGFRPWTIDVFAWPFLVRKGMDVDNTMIIYHND
jgi:hypothetical protein